VALVSDVPERKAFDQLRAAATGRAERLVKITAAVADAVTTDQVFSAVVDHVAAAVNASSAALWLVDDDGRTAKLARSVGYRESTNREFDRVTIESNPSIPAMDAIRRRQAVWIPSQEALLRDYPHLRGSVTSERTYRVSCLPLVSQGRTLGALGLTIEDAREATAEERDFLMLVARYAGQAIERLRLLDAERKSRGEAHAAADRLALLNQASRAFADADLDLEARLRDVAGELSTALQSSINIALIEPDGLLHLKAVHHPLPEAHDLLKSLSLGAPLQIGEGITGKIAASGQSVLIPTLDPQVAAERAASSYRVFLERYPVYALIGAALRVHGRVIGTVTAARCRQDQSFTAEDLKLLEELGERAAVALENARLHQETVKGRGRAEQLYRFAQSVVAADKVEVVYEAALESIEAALGVRRAAILVFDDQGVMRFKAWRELSDGYRAAVEGHSPWAADATAPEPVIVEDALADPAWASYAATFRSENIAALAFIPVVNRGRLLGKFMLYYDRPRALSVPELEVARAIANHLGSVMARFSALAKLEETIRYNELFAGVLAHDLRTPLSAIMSAAQLLLRRQEGSPSPTDGTARPLSRILGSGERMSTMITQLLDFTESRSGGGVRIDVRPTNLDDLCAQAVAELELVHPELTIAYQVTGDVVGHWDPGRLLQVVSNLLSNAGQHGRRGEPITITLDGSRPAEVSLRIHNIGVVPAELLPHLFDPFRTTRQRRGQSSGLGLGLFIVREIVRAHRGAVDVSSSEGDGTTVSVRLPR
jgi:signal transduction histidine kinase